MNWKHLSCAAEFLFCFVFFFHAIAAWKHEGPGFDSDLGVSFVKLHVLPVWVLLTYPGVRGLKTCEVDKGAALVWVSEPCDGRARPLAALLR